MDLFTLPAHEMKQENQSYVEILLSQLETI